MCAEVLQADVALVPAELHTSFVMTFPVIEISRLVPDLLGSKMAKSTLDTAIPSEALNRSFGIVDDQKVISVAIHKKLSMSGLQPREVCTVPVEGKTAADISEHIMKHDLDVVLIDDKLGPLCAGKMQHLTQINILTHTHIEGEDVVNALVSNGFLGLIIGCSGNTVNWSKSHGVMAKDSALSGVFGPNLGTSIAQMWCTHRALYKQVVVIIDDQALQIKVLQKQLTKAGLLSITFTDGKQFIDAIQQNPKEDWLACVMDQTMPILSGLETLEVIQRDFPDFTVPIFMHSTEDSLVQQFRESGARGYLVKRRSAHTALLSWLEMIKSRTMPDGFVVE